MHPEKEQNYGILKAVPQPGTFAHFITQTDRVSLGHLVKLRKTMEEVPEELVALPETSTFPDQAFEFDFSLRIHQQGAQELLENLPGEISIPRNQWLLVGRKPFTDTHSGLCLLLQHESVSRLHAALTNHHGVLYGCDLSSNNPPHLIKGNQIIPLNQTPEKISGKDYISFGSLLFQIRRLN